MKTLFALATAALALAAPGAAQEKPTTVVPIQLYSYGYSPNPIVLKAGIPVTMVFTNNAGIGHEFKAPAFFRAAKIVSGTVSEEGDIGMGPHLSKSVTLIPVRGTYDVHCGHFFHTQLGMRSRLIVQ